MRKYLFLIIIFLSINSFYSFITDNNVSISSEEAFSEISTNEETSRLQNAIFFHKDFTQFIHDGNSFFSKNVSSNPNIIRDSKGIFLVSSLNIIFILFDNESTILELTDKWEFGNEAYKLRIQSIKPIMSGIPGTSSIRDISTQIGNYYYYDLSIVISKITLKTQSSLSFLCDAKGFHDDGVNLCTDMIDFNKDMYNIYTNNLKKDDIKILNSSEDINFKYYFLWEKKEIITLIEFSDTHKDDN